VRDHHRSVRKIAVVSDSAILNIAPRIVSHFVQAQVQHFDFAERGEAIAWLKQD
jgi:hypothetical protein